MKRTPDAGKIYVAGRDIGELSPWRVPYLRRNLGCVFQDFRLLPNKTVAENVAFVLEVIGRPRNVVRTQVAQVLDLVGLGQEGQAGCPTGCRGASSSGSRSRGRSSTARWCCALTSRPATSTRRRAPASCGSSTASTPPAPRSCQWRRTTIGIVDHRCGVRVVELGHGHLVRDQVRGDVYGDHTGTP